MIGPPDIMEAAERHQSHATSNVANICQEAALAALRGDQATVEEMRQAFDSRRRLMYGMISEIPGVRCVEPLGAFYVFPDVSQALTEKVPTSADLGEALIEETGVAVVPGESFGAPGFLRLSYALGEIEIQRGVSRMSEMLASL